MMRLYLLRHAVAEMRDARAWPDDRLRPLTGGGREKMRAITRGVVALGLSFDVMLESPYVRARETADEVARCFPRLPRLQTVHLTPEGTREGLITQITTLPDAPRAVLLVGHEPDLGELACAMLSGRTGAWLPLKKGGLACLEVERLDPWQPRARLRWLLTPRVLRALG